jgi:hypothetical protein
MIRYALKCSRDHAFESWFSSSAGFDEQAARGLVQCPVCEDAAIEKQIMAPAVRAAPEAILAPEAGAAPGRIPLAEPLPARPAPAERSSPGSTHALLDERAIAARAFMKALRRHVMETTEDVGRDFVEEARRIHFGESEIRAIRGEADVEEARALAEEGIAVMPLPPLGEERH